MKEGYDGGVSVKMIMPPCSNVPTIAPWTVCSAKNGIGILSLPLDTLAIVSSPLINHLPFNPFLRFKSDQYGSTKCPRCKYNGQVEPENQFHPACLVVVSFLARLLKISTRGQRAFHCTLYPGRPL